MGKIKKGMLLIGILVSYFLGKINVLAVDDTAVLNVDENAPYVFGDNGQIQWYIDGQTLYITGEDSGLMGDATNGSPFLELWEEAFFTDIVVKDCKLIGSADYLFADLEHIFTIRFENFDTSEVTSMRGMFRNCAEFDVIDMSDLNTSKVKDMSGMFEGCWQLFDIGSKVFDTSSVTDMSGMFRGCQHGSGYFDLIEQFNMSQVTDVSKMFYECDLEQSLLDLTQWNTSNITKMNDMFYNAQNLAFVDLSGCNLSNVQDMSNMFYNCTTMVEVDMSEVNACELENMQDMFYGCINLKNVDFSYFGAKKVKSTANLFMDLRNLESVFISDFAMGADSSTSCMFLNCIKLTSLDLSRFDVSKVVNMSRMFESCESLESINFTGFSTSNVTNMSGMFKNCGVNRRNINSSSMIDLSGFNTGNVTNMSAMFENFNIGYDVSGFNTSNVTDMSRMFYNSYAAGIENINYSNAKTVENMFYGYSGITMDFRGANFASIDNTTGFLDKSSVKILYTPNSIRSGKEIALPDFFYDVNMKKYTKLTQSDCGMMIVRTEPVGDTVPKNKYHIKVVNTKGEPVFAAFVNYGGSQKLTGGNGKVEFNLTTIGQPLIKITHPDYLVWTNENTNYEKNENRTETIVIYTEEEGELCLKTAQLNNYNVLTETKKMTLKNTGNATGDLFASDFTLACMAINPSKVRKYELWQNDTYIATDPNGIFRLSVDDGFQKGGNCFVRVIGNDGLMVDTHINLTFVENFVNQDTSISMMGKSLKVEVRDDVPFLGGNSFELSMPESPVEFYFTDEKVYIGFNLDLDGEVTDVDKYMKNLKRDMEDFKRAESAYKKGGKAFKDYMKKNNQFGFFGAKFDFNYVGYIEFDSGSNVGKGEVYIEYKGSAQLVDFNTFIPPIWPVTAQIKGNVNMQLGTMVTYNRNTGIIESEIPLELSIGLDAYGGIGVGTAASGGVYGKAKAGVDWVLFGINPGLKNFYLTGELGVRGYLGPFSNDWPFAYNTWYIYTANNVVSSVRNENYREILYDASYYKKETLEYLHTESAWNGYGMNLVDNTVYTNLIPLLQGTFYNAQPTIVSDGNVLYASFLRGDAETNQIYAVCTKMQDGIWSEPIRVDENSILDGTPLLFMDGNETVWLAYTKTREKSQDDSLQGYARMQSVMVGTVNPDTLRLENIREFEGVNYAHASRLSTVNGKPVLAWIDTAIIDDNSVLVSKDNAIYYSIYEDGAWQEAKVLCEINHPIRQLIVCEEGVGCVVDLDDDLLTSDDASLYVYDMNGNRTIVAEGVKGKVVYDLFPGENKKSFIWNDVDRLCNVNNSIAIKGIAQDYVIVNGDIYYSAAIEGGRELVVTRRGKEGTYSMPTQLTNSGKYVESFSVISQNEQDIVVGMETTANISETGLDVSSDLVWGIVQPAHDIRIDYIDYDRSIITPGTSVPITIGVTNAGDHNVDTINVYVNEEKIPVSVVDLQAGQEQEITLNIPCPSEVTEYVIQAIDADSSLENDYTPDNNNVSIKLGQGNFVVQARIQQIGDNISIISEVANEGTEKLSGIVVVKDDSGNELCSEQISDLESGETRVIEVPIAVSDAGNMYYVTVTSEQEELYLFDNSAELYLPGDTSTAITYSISYMLDGGTQNIHNPVSYQKLENDIILMDPTKEGYQFAGWYSDEELTIQKTRIEKGNTGNIVLYAKWTPNVYHIEFDGNGASGAMSSLQNQAYGTSFTLPENDFVWRGHTFIEWNTKADGSGQAYNDCQRVENLTAKNGESVRLYAQWAVNKYVVEFDGNGADIGNMDAMTDLLYGKTYYLTTNVFQKEGYIFTGWNTEVDGSGESYPDGAQIENLTEQPYKVVTLYAQWKKEEVRIQVIEITLNKTDLRLQVGDVDVLSATVTPENATDKSVVWDSSEPAVATVDANGKVTAVEAGTATITATAKDGSGKSASCKVTVTEPMSRQEEQVRAFVERMYTIVLNRAAEEQGLAEWTMRLMAKEIDGATLVDMFVNSDEFINRNTSDEEYIKILYRAVLGREADTDGLKMWKDMLADDWTRDYILDGLVLSVEFKNICDSYGIIAAFEPTAESQVRSFVKRMYTVVLNRRADVVGLSEWTQRLMNGTANGAQVADGFISSQEFANRNLSNEKYVKVLYRAFFNREADEGGFNVWMNELAKGASRRDVMKGFVHSVEFSDLCAQYGIIRGEIQ